LAHQEPDRVPIDIGGHSASSMAPGSYANLCRHLSLPVPEQVRLMSKALQIVYMDEPVIQAVRSDCRPLIAPQLIATGPVAWEGGRFKDEWGVEWCRPESSAYYEVERFPLAGLTAADLDRYPWPDPHDPKRTAGLAGELQRLVATDYAIVGVPSSLNIFERALLLRGFEQLLLDMAMEPELVHKLFQRLLEFNIAVYTDFLKIAGQQIDVIRVADDLGGTQAPLISPQMYREMLKPYHQEWFRVIKTLTPAKICLHSDGALVPLLPDLIEAGVDALNPVQVFAAGMETANLKREFGKHLTFWGGVDTVTVLPKAGRQQVIDEVRRRIEDLAAGGGFVLAGVHNLQADVPPENIMTMIEAARTFGQYPLARAGNGNRAAAGLEWELHRLQ
jgi:uroporphyrinogen decarboxylase